MSPARQLVWDYKTGDVIDAETGEVVDRVFDESDDLEDTPLGLRWSTFPMLPSISMSPQSRRVYARVLDRLEELGIGLETKRRIELAAFISKLRRGRKKLMTDEVTLLFLLNQNLDNRYRVRRFLKVNRLQYIKGSRWKRIVSLVEAALADLRKGKYTGAAYAVLDYIYKKNKVSGRAAAAIAAAAVHTALVMVDPDPPSKVDVGKCLGTSVTFWSPITILQGFRIDAPRELCERVSRVAVLHERVVCR